MKLEERVPMKVLSTPIRRQPDSRFPNEKQKRREERDRMKREAEEAEAAAAAAIEAEAARKAARRRQIPDLPPLKKLQQLRISYAEVGKKMGIKAEIEAIKEEIREIEAEMDYNRHIDVPEDEQYRLMDQLYELRDALDLKVFELEAHQQRARTEERTGISLTPFGQHVGDVWSRDRLSDIVYLVIRQKRMRQQQIATPEQFLARGLPLLQSIKLENNVERAVAEEEDLLAGKKNSIYIPEGLHEMKGVRKMKFLKMNKLDALATSMKRVNANATPSMKLTSTISDKILYGNPTRLYPSKDPEVARNSRQLQSAPASAAAAALPTAAPSPTPARSTKSFHQFHDDASSLGQDSLPGPHAVGSAGERVAMVRASGRGGGRDAAARTGADHAATLREIETLSTRSNLKYMRIGDDGASDLAAALDGDMTIREVCLAGARISSRGLQEFAATMPRMLALRVLDLSNNLICNKGADVLAAALPQCRRLESLSLGGNRIKLHGILKLLQAAFECPTLTHIRLGS